MSNLMRQHWRVIVSFSFNRDTNGVIGNEIRRTLIGCGFEKCSTQTWQALAADPICAMTVLTNTLETIANHNAVEGVDPEFRVDHINIRIDRFNQSEVAA